MRECEPDWVALEDAAASEAAKTPELWVARNLLAVQREIWDKTNQITWKAAARRLIIPGS